MLGSAKAFRAKAFGRELKRSLRLCLNEPDLYGCSGCICDGWGVGEIVLYSLGSMFLVFGASPRKTLYNKALSINTSTSGGRNGPW